MNVRNKTKLNVQSSDKRKNSKCYSKVEYLVVGNSTPQSVYVLVVVGSLLVRHAMQLLFSGHFVNNFFVIQDFFVI